MLTPRIFVMGMGPSPFSDSLHLTPTHPHPEEPRASSREASRRTRVADAAPQAAHPSRRLPSLREGRLLRACESFDLGDFRHESNQGLSTTGIRENRKDSQTLRMRFIARLRSRRALGNVPAKPTPPSTAAGAC